MLRLIAGQAFEDASTLAQRARRGDNAIKARAVLAAQNPARVLKLGRCEIERAPDRDLTGNQRAEIDGHRLPAAHGDDRPFRAHRTDRLLERRADPHRIERRVEVLVRQTRRVAELLAPILIALGLMLAAPAVLYLILRRRFLFVVAVVVAATIPLMLLL